MDPIRAAENKNMPTKSVPTVDLTDSQLTALFGDGGVVPGETYELKLKAGDVGDSGSQTFEILSMPESESEDESGMSPAEDLAEDMAEGETPDMEEESNSPDEEVRALGYDRKKMMSKRGKASPKLDLKDLEY